MKPYPDRVDYLPIIDRPAIRWPNGARVAFWVAPNVEHHEYLPVFNGRLDPYPRLPYPDVRDYSYCHYGNRVGFWRMLEVLDKHRIRCTVSLNVAVLEHFPEVRDAMCARDWAFMSHGIYNTAYLTTLSEAEERAFYADTIATLARHTGRRLKGMLGPNLTGTGRTPDLMAEAGLVYHCDWLHDDQPAPIRVRSGRLVSVPYALEINDSQLLKGYCDGAYFERMVRAQFDRLYREGAESGRVMCLALHPYVVGQPHRARYLDRALAHILAHEGVWQATADEIAEHFLAHHYDQWVAHAARFRA
ncbi:MAG: polysaccharide deacetylase family protein [Proteobacteria bacterium]|nr:polysaccharide deacetylase family protein [Pseudomonadota bacterium]